jgi:ribosomal protein S16
MPGGRPPKINTVVLTRDDPNNGRKVKVTAGQRIVEALRIGEYVETAAELAGVSKRTVYEWLKVGAQATDAVERQGRTLKSLTQHQRDCMEFSHAVAEAQALARTDDVATLADLAHGGRPIVTTTVKRDKDGAVLEHVTRTETAQPNAAVLMWRLERRHPEDWGRRRIEISGPDGEAIPLEVRASSLVAALRQHQGTAIETTATDTVRDDDEAGEG